MTSFGNRGQCAVFQCMLNAAVLVVCNQKDLEIACSGFNSDLSVVNQIPIKSLQTTAKIEIQTCCCDICIAFTIIMDTFARLLLMQTGDK
jgi:hypothetical protein